MPLAETISASEFKAKCLEIFTSLSTKKLTRVVVTKRGRPVAVVIPAPGATAGVENLYGFMEGSVVIPEGFDMTAPVLEETLDAATGAVHR